MNSKLRINKDDKGIINIFKNELEAIKNIMETEEEKRFYLNIIYLNKEIETIKLYDVEEIIFSITGFAVFSKNTHSSSYILYDKLRGLEIVEK